MSKKFEFNEHCWCCNETENSLKYCAEWMQVIIDYHFKKNVSLDELDNALEELAHIVGADYPGRE